MSEASNDDFPSGPWAGFYLYAAGGARHRMELTLNFREGLVSGDGFDDVGPFLLHGSYSAETREVRWVKNYPGSHNVHYRGFREGKGIWGVWEIPPVGRGGFKIWPKGMGTEEGEVDWAEEEVPVELVGTFSPQRRGDAANGKFEARNSKSETNSKQQI